MLHRAEDKSFKILRLHLQVMKRFFCILGWIIIGFFAQGQSLQGFYTGQVKIPGFREPMQVQLDLLEEDGGYRGVFRSRFVENNAITGCDNWVEGRLIGNKMVLKNLATTRETGVPDGACNMLKEISMNFNEKREAPEFICIWENNDNTAFKRFKLSRIDTEVSYTIEEEREIAYRKMSGMLIFRAPSDSVRIGMMLSYRPTEIKDTIEVTPGDLEIQITAPDADPFHLVTILINNQPAAIKRAPKQQGLKILLNTSALEDAFILFLCEHALVDVLFDVKVVFNWLDKNASFTMPVSTFSNNGFWLRVRQDGEESSNH